MNTALHFFSLLADKYLKSVLQGERYRDDFVEDGPFRAKPHSGNYGYSSAVPPSYEDVVKNYQEDHK